MGRTLAAWLLMAAAAAAPTMTPRDVVQSAVMRVLQTIEDAQASQQAGRPNPEKVRLEIRRIATDLFDFDEVSRRALSRHWAARTSQEQAEFISLFTDLLERSYVGKIESYSGEKIAYTGELVDGDYELPRVRDLLARVRLDLAHVGEIGRAHV